MAASFRQISILLLAFLQASFPLASFRATAVAAAGRSVGHSYNLRCNKPCSSRSSKIRKRVIAQLLVSESDRNSQIARSALLPHADIEAQGYINQYNVQSIERAPKRGGLGPSTDHPSRP